MTSSWLHILSSCANPDPCVVDNLRKMDFIFRRGQIVLYWTNWRQCLDYCKYYDSLRSYGCFDWCQTRPISYLCSVDSYRLRAIGHPIIKIWFSSFDFFVSLPGIFYTSDVFAHTSTSLQSKAFMYLFNRYVCKCSTNIINHLMSKRLEFNWRVMELSAFCSVIHEQLYHFW